MSQSFCFVNGTGAGGADEASRKLMRRHVMKGKNAGKTMTRPSRKHVSDTGMAANYKRILVRYDARSEANKDENCPTWRYVLPATVAKGFPNVHLAFSFPIAITPYELGVINDWFDFIADRLYPARLGLSLDDAKYDWLKILSTDEATFRCNFALMQACNEMFRSKDEYSSRSIYYLSKTLIQVKKRLEGDEALADSTLGIVLALINQEQMRKEYTSAKIHLGGLARMVQLRGGIDKLDYNPPVALKVGKTDVLFALQYGGPPYFFRDKMAKVRQTLSAQGLNFDCPLEVKPACFDEIDFHLRESLLDAMSFASLFNGRLKDHLLDLYTFQEVKISICYRLLQYRQLGEMPSSPDVQAVYHIGLIVFMMSIFIHYDSRRVIEFDIISKHLRSLLEAGTDELDNRLAFWLVIMSGIWVSGDRDKDWILPFIVKAAVRLGVTSWDDAAKQLAIFPWIYMLHDDPGQDVWNRAILEGL